MLRSLTSVIKPTSSQLTNVISKTPIRHASIERSLNRVTLLGRVGADAQLKGTYEHPVVIFNLATTQNNKTDWHRISVFKPGLRELAENYVKSGNRLMVEGKISYGHIIDRNGGSIPTTSIIAEEVIFLSSSNSTNSNRDLEDSTQSVSSSASQAD